MHYTGTIHNAVSILQNTGNKHFTMKKRIILSIINLRWYMKEQMS